MANNYFFMCMECSHQSLYWNQCPASCPVCGASGSSISCVANESLAKILRENAIAVSCEDNEEPPLTSLRNRLDKIEQAQGTFSVWDAFQTSVGQWAATHAMEALMGGLTVAIAFLVMLLQ